jgi:hypothetical protein
MTVRNSNRWRGFSKPPLKCEDLTHMAGPYNDHLGFLGLSMMTNKVCTGCEDVKLSVFAKDGRVQRRDGS